MTSQANVVYGVYVFTCLRSLLSLSFSDGIMDQAPLVEREFIRVPRIGSEPID
jgi:hypothetical protein